MFYLFFLENLLFYKFTVNTFPSLSLKQKSHVLSIKSSFILTIFSLYFNLFSYNEFVGNMLIHFFSGYLLADLSVGIFKYPEYMQITTGYIHHSIYLFINYISFNNNLNNIYLLFFVSELPTLILSIGQFDSKLRNNNLFGITFFSTRIMYHMLLIYKYISLPYISIFGSLTLTVHCYWFKGWVIKYSNLFKK